MITPLLTLVTDRRAASMPLPELASLAVEGGVDLVQVRERDVETADLDRLVADVIAAVGSEHVAVNDEPGIAVRRGVHLHLPERSMARFEATPAVPALSCSIHSIESLNLVPPVADYLLLGHLFPTATHPDLSPLDRDKVAAIIAASARPVVGIGGISPENAAAAMSLGMSGVAVVSYVNSSPEPKSAARGLRDALESAMSQQTASISVQVNGKPISVDPDTSLSAFLERRNLHARLVVVERNREIVAKSAYDSTLLEEGDLLEIAHFVGGG